MQSEKYKEYITYTVFYEELIKDCDKIQKEVSEKLSLDVIYKWSDYPKWFDNSEEPRGGLNKNGYILRPIGEKY